MYHMFICECLDAMYHMFICEYLDGMYHMFICERLDTMYHMFISTINKNQRGESTPSFLILSLYSSNNINL